MPGKSLDELQPIYWPLRCLLMVLHWAHHVPHDILIGYFPATVKRESIKQQTEYNSMMSERRLGTPIDQKTIDKAEKQLDDAKRNWLSNLTRADRGSQWGFHLIDTMNELYDCNQALYGKLIHNLPVYKYRDAINKIERWMVPLLRTCFSHDFAIGRQVRRLQPFGFLYSESDRVQYSEFCTQYQGLYVFVRLATSTELVHGKGDLVRCILKIYPWDSNNLCPRFCYIYRGFNSSGRYEKEIVGNISVRTGRLYFIGEEVKRFELSYLVWPREGSGPKLGADGMFFGSVTASDTDGNIFSATTICRRLTLDTDPEHVDDLSIPQRLRAGPEIDEFNKIGLFAKGSLYQKDDVIMSLLDTRHFDRLKTLSIHPLQDHVPGPDTRDVN